MAAMADERRDDDPDATQAHEPVSGEPARSGDEQSSGDEEPSGGEETAFLGGGDETSILPQSPAPDSTERLPRWAARAGVPPAGTRPQYRTDTPTEQWQADQQPERSWWLPAVLALVALALLGVLGAGIFLILGSLDNEPNPVTTTTASASPTPSPTAPSPTAPSPTPSPTAPAQVAVPSVVGMTRLAAEQALVTAGLTSVTQTRVVEGATPGRVVEVSPAVGTLVPVGSQVTLIVAAVPPTTEPPPTPSPSSS